MKVLKRVGAFIKGLSTPMKIVGVVFVCAAVGGTTAAVVILNNRPAENVEVAQVDVAESDEKKSDTDANETDKAESGNQEEGKKAASSDEASNKSNSESAGTKSTTSETKSSEKVSGSSNSTATSGGDAGKTQGNASGSSTGTSNSAGASNSTQQSSGSSSSAQSSVTPAKQPDYNLNDRYVAGWVDWVINDYVDETGMCQVVETKRFFGVTKFTGHSSDLYDATSSQYAAYMKQHGYSLDCGGMGGTYITWEQAVANGTALDEAKCQQYGLSCGRW